MFLFFVAVTLVITYWAAMRTKTAAQFYAAGGGITGLQNGLAIAGDYMSAASFLGISAFVYAWGYDGLIYSVGWLVGWPIVTFLIAEPLRNLGRYTFADVASFQFEQTPVRVLAACGTLVTVAFYLVAQMVGAGAVIHILFPTVDYKFAVVGVGILMILYVTFGGMIATTWVQIIKACLLLGGATLMALLVLIAFGFNPGALFSKAVEVHPLKDAIMGPIFKPGAPVSTPLSAISTGLALMFGTCGLPHILMRFFTVPNAKEARKSVLYATGFIGYFYILTFIIGFGAIVFVSTNPDFIDQAKITGRHERDPGNQGLPEHAGAVAGKGARRRPAVRLHLGGGFRNDPGGRLGAHAGGGLGDQPRPLRQCVRPRESRRSPRDSRFENRHGMLGRFRRPHRHIRPKHQCRLRGRPRLRHRGVVQLPGASL